MLQKNNSLRRLCVQNCDKVANDSKYFPITRNNKNTASVGNERDTQVFKVKNLEISKFGSATDCIRSTYIWFCERGVKFAICILGIQNFFDGENVYFWKISEKYL